MAKIEVNRRLQAKIKGNSSRRINRRSGSGSSSRSSTGLFAPLERRWGRGGGWERWR